MNTPTLWRRRVSYGLAAAMVLVCQVAEACPGCRQAVGGDGAGGSYKTNLVALGYALSIGFMLFMVASLLGGLGYLMYRNCRTLAAQQQAMLREEERFGGGASAIGIRV